MFRILTGIYTEKEEYWLKAMAAALARVIRVDEKRARVFGPKDGLSRHYRWGHTRGSYIQTLPDIDAQRLMSNPHIGYEFRDMNTNPEQEPIIPEVWMNRIIWHCLEVARNGPDVYLSGDVPAMVNRPVSDVLGMDSGHFNLPTREVAGFVY